MSFPISEYFKALLGLELSQITAEICRAVVREVAYPFFPGAISVIANLANEVGINRQLRVNRLKELTETAVVQIEHLMSSLPLRLAIEQHFSIALLYRKTHGLAAHCPLDDVDLDPFLLDGQPTLDSQSVGAGPLLQMALDASQLLVKTGSQHTLVPWSKFNLFHRQAVCRFAADIGVSTSLAKRYGVAFCCFPGGPGVLIYSASCETDTHGHRTVRPRFDLKPSQLLLQQLFEGPLCTTAIGGF